MPMWSDRGAPGRKKASRRSKDDLMRLSSGRGSLGWCRKQKSSCMSASGLHFLPRMSGLAVSQVTSAPVSSPRVAPHWKMAPNCERSGLPLSGLRSPLKMHEVAAAAAWMRRARYRTRVLLDERCGKCVLSRVRRQAGTSPCARATTTSCTPRGRSRKNCPRSHDCQAGSLTAGDAAPAGCLSGLLVSAEHASTNASKAVCTKAEAGEPRRRSTTSWPAIEPRRYCVTAEWRQRVAQTAAMRTSRASGCAGSGSGSAAAAQNASRRRSFAEATRRTARANSWTAK
mmetsp:Transcript_7549/g.24231  ORF Transcript_7549/g.24231 Transcript_7549/m.24231 type:complete len:285 (-) Transcript_7549:856-1710(-)